MKDKKPNTLQSKLGFLDDDLKKPSHDKMMIWLDSQVQKILDDRFVQEVTDQQVATLRAEAIELLRKVVIDRSRVLKHYVSQSNYYESKSSLDDTEQKKLADYNLKIDAENKKIDFITKWKDFRTKPLKPSAPILKKTWELPITTQAQYSSGTSSKYTVGFVDMAVQFQIPRPCVRGIISERDTEITRSNSEWLYNISDEIEVGFHFDTAWIYIEVKTEIKSLGELIRQINHYKEYLNGHYYVLCPNVEHRDILQSQGIGFIEFK